VSAPQRRTPRQHLVAEGIGTVAVQSVLLTVAAALAISRAAHNLLSPGVLAAVVAGVGVTSGLMGRPLGVFEGALAILDGRVASNDDPLVPVAGSDPIPSGSGDQNVEGDAFDGRRLRRSALVWGAGVGAWAGAAALLVAATLRGRQAPFVVTAVALVVVGTAASVVAGLVGRAEGMTAARRAVVAPAVPQRRRAWRDIALPMGLVQAVFNAAFAVLLFRDYRPLTESAARADALIVVVIITAIFGALAMRWGRVDAALGRIAVDDGALAGVNAKHPLGPQALVYLAGAGLLAFAFAGWLLPPLPSLARVAIVRGAVSGLLAVAVCGVAHVRGALNTLVGARVDAPPRKQRDRRRRRGPSAGVVAHTVLIAAIAAAALVGPAAIADAPAKRLAAEGDAFVARIEYDIPLPAGSGSIARVTGRVGPPTGENAYGLAAAPSHLDAVVSGTWFNPLADEDPLTPGDQAKGPVDIPDENRLPQVECFFPPDDVKVRFDFPTDVRDDTAATPPVGYAAAQCGRGPTSEVHARAADVAGGALFRSGPAGADGLFRPVKGVLQGTANAWAHDVALLGGAIRIASVTADGASSVTGEPGGQKTLARIALHDVDVAGTRFSVDGDQLIVAGRPEALDSAAARTVLGAANAALAPLGCSVTVVGATDRYPQGFVLARKPPDVGVRDDGTLAGSMAGGLLVVCDLPENATKPSGFSPQRMQILVGFVYTSAAASEGVGGFGLGDLVGPPGTGAGTPVGGRLGDIGALPSAVGASPAPATPAAAPVSPAPARTPAGEAIAPKTVAARFVAVAGVFGAWPLWLLAALVWLVLTDRGLHRLSLALAPPGDSR
jgi:hypothetical protein